MSTLSTINQRTQSCRGAQIPATGRIESGNAVSQEPHGYFLCAAVYFNRPMIDPKFSKGCPSSDRSGEAVQRFAADMENHLLSENAFT
jgi:hypothetical protein